VRYALLALLALTMACTDTVVGPTRYVPGPTVVVTDTIYLPGKPTILYKTRTIHDTIVVYEITVDTLTVTDTLFVTCDGKRPSAHSAVLCLTPGGDK
jgi:hypothetical protein